MARQKKQDFTLTASGFEYDKELSRVTIKMIPALQALIANQHELMEITRRFAPDKFIFLEAHAAELTEVEETVAKAYTKYCNRKEESKMKRKEQENVNQNQDRLTQFDDPVSEEDTLLDELAATISPGLPSSRFTQEKPLPAKKEETDIRRVAIGASIKALSSLLGRELTDQEITVIEKQVDAYL